MLGNTPRLELQKTLYFYQMMQFLVWKNIAGSNLQLKNICFLHLVAYLQRNSFPPGRTKLESWYSLKLLFSCFGQEQRFQGTWETCSHNCVLAITKITTIYHHQSLVLPHLYPQAVKLSFRHYAIVRIQPSRSPP